MRRRKSSNPERLLGALALTAALGGSASGEQLPEEPEAEPLVVVIAAECGLDPLPTLRAIEQELDMPVIPLGVPGARGTRGLLTITRDSQGFLLFVYVSSEGAEIWRRFPIEEGASPEEIRAALALLAGNLVRDQIADLLAELDSLASEPPPERVDPAIDPPEAPVPHHEDVAETPGPAPRTEPPSDRPPPWFVEPRLAQSFNNNATFTNLGIQVGYAFTHVAMALEAQASVIRVCERPSCAELTPYTLGFDTTARGLSVGRLTFELGLFLGARIFQVEGPNEQNLVYPLLRAHLRAAVSVTRRFDVVLGSTVATTFRYVSRDQPGKRDILSPVELGVVTGLRIRLP